MKITKLSIKHFKTYQDVEFNFTQNINIFTGINNCGKTTILEAIALWNECFSKLIRKAKGKDSVTKLKMGDFRLGNKRQNYFEFNDIESVRSPRYKDIFYNLDTSIDIKITIDFSHENNNISIGFILSKAAGNNYDISVDMDTIVDYEKFNDFFQRLPIPVNIIYASPISNILYTEQFEREIIISNEIKKRNSARVLRNRLYKLETSRDNKKNLFLQDLAYVLYDNEQDIELIKKGDYETDININFNITLGTSDVEKDISLLGSGTLQIIEILLSFYETKSDINIILLDEPDSHIHRDIQKRLMLLLEKHTYSTEIFITTHNESLIRSSNPNYIFHLEKNTSKHYFPIGNGIDNLSNIGLQATKKLKILKELGGEDALDFINALETDKLIFVEGKYDPLYLQLILDKKYINQKFNVMYWSFEGVNNIFKYIESYKTLFTNIKNKKTLWEKSLLIFDRDYLTQTQASKLSTELSNKSKLNIPVYIWGFYTMESVFLTDITKYAKLLLVNMKKEDIKADLETIKKELNQCIVLKSQEKLKELDDSKYQGQIKKWITDKKELLKNLTVSSNCIGDYHDFYSYMKNELENNRLEAIATKDDIADISRYIYDKYSFTNYSKKDLFYELLQLIEASTWFDEWDIIVDMVEG